jgi:hypothetical protein
MTKAPAAGARLEFFFLFFSFLFFSFFFFDELLLALACPPA